MQSVAVIAFALNENNYRVMASSRFFTGMFQVFISIFGPIWCDVHAPADRKTTWITWFIVATPLGMVAGYLLTALILSLEGNWAITFYVQVLLLVPIAFYIASIDSALLKLTPAEPDGARGQQHPRDLDGSGESSMSLHTNDDLKQYYFN